MDLGQKTAELFERFAQQNPWVSDIVKKFGLDLSSYDFFRISQSGGVRLGQDFLETIYFLKAFEEYVSPSLPPDFSSVLDVGIGSGRYIRGLTSFFHTYNQHARIIGIDIDEICAEFAKEIAKTQNITDVEIRKANINDFEGQYDVVLNLCPNLIDSESFFIGYLGVDGFFRAIRERTKKNGLFVLGITNHPFLEPEEAMKAISPFFDGMVVHNNQYIGRETTFPLKYLITARPKQNHSQTQS